MPIELWANVLGLGRGQKLKRIGVLVLLGEGKKGGGG